MLIELETGGVANQSDNVATPFVSHEGEHRIRAFGSHVMETGPLDVVLEGNGIQVLPLREVDPSERLAHGCASFTNIKDILGRT